MKKLVSMFVAIVLIISSLTGCSKKNNNDNLEDQNKTTASPDYKQPEEKEPDGEAKDPSEEEWTGKVSRIIMTYLTLGNTPADLQKVQDAINEMTIKKIGVEVELKPISAYEAFSQFPTWLATGETIDLMFPLLQDLKAYVNQGLIEPLDELIAKNAPYIQKLTDEGYPIAAGNKINDEIWAVSQVANLYGLGGSYLIDEKYVNETGFDYDPKRVYTLDDLTGLFASIKELYPNMYPCGVVTTGRTSSEFVYANGVYDPTGGAQSFTGVLMGIDGTTVVNLFETEEYKDYLAHLREWYLAGYIHPDATITDSTNVSLMNAGVTSGYFMVSAPVQRKGGQLQIRLTDVFMPAVGLGGWVVPMTSKEPEAAVRFLNMMYEDPALTNLLQWGIEGEHYVVIDEEINLIGFPEGVDSSTSGYYNTLGLYGDTREVYIWDASQSQAENDAYTAEAMKNPTSAYGLTYSPADNVAVKITAIQAVVAQYLPSLESGSVDLDTYYPEFINALKAAGIDDVIKDKQKQFDEWNASK